MSLTPDYFNGDKIRQLEAILAKYDKNIIAFNESKSPIIKEEDLRVNYSVLERLRKEKPTLEKNLLFFCNNTEVVDVTNVDPYMVRLRYPKTEGKCYDFFPRDLSPFFESELYTLYPDFEKYDRLVASSSFDFKYTLPPMRCQLDDGQLKIATDLILALDAADMKQGDKILVIGSAADSGSLSGLSYELISEITPGVTVDLYDENDYNGSFMTCVDDKITVFNHYNEFKILSEKDPLEYKLLMDDAYAKDKEVMIFRTNWDKDDIFHKFENYSVKWFLDWKEPPHNLYPQAFRTPSQEHRAVSRSAQFTRFIPHPYLGNCAGCRELKFSLHKPLSREASRLYMRIHKRDCITGMNQRNVQHDRDQFGTELSLEEKRKKNRYFPRNWYPMAENISLEDIRYRGFSSFTHKNFPRPVVVAGRKPKIFVTSPYDIPEFLMSKAIVVLYHQGAFFCNRFSSIFTFKANAVIDLLLNVEVVRRFYPVKFSLYMITGKDKFSCFPYHRVEDFDQVQEDMRTPSKYRIVFTDPFVIPYRLFFSAVLLYVHDGKYYVNRRYEKYEYLSKTKPLWLDKRLIEHFKDSNVPSEFSEKIALETDGMTSFPNELDPFLN